MGRVGRPSLKTEDTVAEICERLSHGEPLARICDDPRMPSFLTVWKWERDDEQFRNLSARAREIGTHYIADDCIRIADDPELDPKDKRVRVDTRLRLIGKWNSKRYGEATLLKHADNEGGALPLPPAPMQIIVVRAVEGAVAPGQLIEHDKGDGDE